MIWKFALPLLSRAEIFSKIKRFVEVFWKFELPLSLRAEIFSKIKRFVEVFWKCELHLSSRAKLWQKYGTFYEVTWKFGLALLSRTEVFTKIKQLCWSVLKIWTSPIITSWNFRKNKAVLLKCFGNLDCPYYHELKFL